MSKTDTQGVLRQHLLEMLSNESAHAGFDRAVADLPEELRGAKPPGINLTRRGGWLSTCASRSATYSISAAMLGTNLPHGPKDIGPPMTHRAAQKIGIAPLMNSIPIEPR